MYGTTMKWNKDLCLSVASVSSTWKHFCSKSCMRLTGSSRVLLRIVVTSRHHIIWLTVSTIYRQQQCVEIATNDTHTHTHTRLTALCPGLPGWAGTRKAKAIWILLKQETVSGSGISSRQITMPAPHQSVFYRPDAVPAAQPTASKHWRHTINK